MNKSSSDKFVLRDKLNRPMQDLRISVTDKCNLNCNYCMPSKDIEFLDKRELLTFEEIERFVRVGVELGIRKVKLTGGEPTLRVGIDVLIEKLLKVDGVDDLGLITNGYFLKSIGHRLKKSGLQRISVSVDAIDNRIFQNIAGLEHGIHPVLEGIEVAVKLGFSPIKINCVIRRGVNENQILPLATYFRRENFHLRFIEFMDVGNISWDESRVVTSKQIFDIINSKYPLEKKDADFYGEVANRYVYKDGLGEVGFISSVSQPFCSDCTRLRLSADGKLYGCLFTVDGYDIKSVIRSNADDNAIREAIKVFWENREDRYSEERAVLRGTLKKPGMNYMGG